MLTRVDLIRILVRRSIKKSNKIDLIPMQVQVTHKDPRTGKPQIYMMTVYVSPEMAAAHGRIMPKEKFREISPEKETERLYSYAESLYASGKIAKEIPGPKIPKVGNIFEKSLATALKYNECDINRIISKTLEEHKDIANFWKEYTPEEQNLIKYNLAIAIADIHTFAYREGKIILGAEFTGSIVGTGKKADIVVYFKDKKQPITNLSKIQLNEKNMIGISLKTKQAGEWLGLQESSYAAIYKQALAPKNIQLNIPPDYARPEAIESRKKIHQQLLNIPQQKLREALEEFISKAFKDKNFPDLMLFIRDFKRNKTFYGKEKDIENKFLELMKKAKFVIKLRGDKQGISSIEWRDPVTNKMLIYVNAHIKSRGSMSFRLNYNAVIKILESIQK